MFVFICSEFIAGRVRVTSRSDLVLCVAYDVSTAAHWVSVSMLQVNMAKVVAVNKLTTSSKKFAVKVRILSVFEEFRSASDKPYGYGWVLCMR